MLRSVLALSILSLSLNALAVELRPCSTKDLKYLIQSANNAKADGLTNALNLRNSKQEVVGYYAYNAIEARAAVCDGIAETPYTVATEWYYWDNNESPNPAKWKRGQVLRITQDEGGVDLKVLKASSSGDVTVQISVLGMGEDDFVVVRNQTLHMTK